MLCCNAGPGKPLQPVERTTIRLALPSKGRMAEDSLGLMKVATFPGFPTYPDHVEFLGEQSCQLGVPSCKLELHYEV